PRSCGTVRKVPATVRATRSNSRCQRLPMARSTSAPEETTQAGPVVARRFPANSPSTDYSRSKSRIDHSWAGIPQEGSRSRLAKYILHKQKLHEHFECRN